MNEALENDIFKVACAVSQSAEITVTVRTEAGEQLEDVSPNDEIHAVIKERLEYSPSLKITILLGGEEVEEVSPVPL